jgi:3-carboxy-cis,cis-muconate cycloisomerase
VLAWRDGIRHARQLLLEWRSTAPVQLGGPVGDRAEITEVAGPETAAVIRATATSLRLVPHRPWPTTRGPVTDLAHALVTATSAWGHLANDVLLMSSSELGEVSEPRSRERGGSSSMPHKHNSVLSILLRRCARSTPLLQAQLQLAATDSVQERSPGGWHGEWPALRDLWRQVLAAGDQATELVRGLEVHGERMEANLQAARVPTMDAVAAGELIDRALEDG